MKEKMKKAVADVEAQMGDLKGFVVMAIDDKKQLNSMEGPLVKMFVQLAEDNDEFFNVLDNAIKGAKLRRGINRLMEDAKEAGLLLEDNDISETKS